jgi:hypothetical protein
VVLPLRRRTHHASFNWLATHAVNSVAGSEIVTNAVDSDEVLDDGLNGDDVGRESGNKSGYNAPSVDAGFCVQSALELGVGAVDFRDDAVVAPLTVHWVAFDVG